MNASYNDITSSSAITVDDFEFPIQQIIITKRRKTGDNQTIEDDCVSSFKDSLHSSLQQHQPSLDQKKSRCRSSFQEAFVKTTPKLDSIPTKIIPRRIKSSENPIPFAKIHAATRQRYGGGSGEQRGPTTTSDRWATGSRERVSPSMLLRKSTNPSL